jgi:hypothetical protein
VTFPIAHWPDVHFPNAHWPHAPRQGGGGGKKKFKSWDQRERERQEQIRQDVEAKKTRAEADNRAKYGDLPKVLSDALERPEAPYKRVSPATVKAYANSRANDDEEAMQLIAGLI